MEGAMPRPWTPLAEFEKSERNRIRFALRTAADNDIVADGVACKFGRLWYINVDRLPEWAVKRTRLALHGHASDSPPQRRRRGDTRLEAV